MKLKFISKFISNNLMCKVDQQPANHRLQKRRESRIKYFYKDISTLFRHYRKQKEGREIDPATFIYLEMMSTHKCPLLWKPIFHGSSN